MIDQNLVNKASVIADKMYNGSGKKEDGVRSIMEAIDLLYSEDYTETSEPFGDCQGLLREMACLLTDPKISSKLSEGYYQKNAGRLLLNMMDLFRELGDSPRVRNYIIYYRLKNYASRMTLEQIDFFGERLPLC